MLADALPVYVSTTGNVKAYTFSIIDCTGDLHSTDSRNVTDPAPAPTIPASAEATFASTPT